MNKDDMLKAVKWEEDSDVNLTNDPDIPDDNDDWTLADETALHDYQREADSWGALQLERALEAEAAAFYKALAAAGITEEEFWTKA